MVIVIHIQHIIFSDKCLNHEKNKRIKKSGARGIRTPDFGHEETKSAYVATRASYSFVYETHIIKYKINSVQRFEKWRHPPSSSSTSSFNIFEILILSNLNQWPRCKHETCSKFTHDSKYVTNIYLY